MRQALFILPLFMLLLAVIYLFSPHLGGRTAPERFLDRQTLLLINQKNLAARLDVFFATKLGRTLTSIDYPGILNDLDVAHEKSELLEQLIHLAAAARHDPMVRSVLGRDLTIVLTPFQLRPEEPLLRQLVEHALVICRPKRAAHALELVRRISSPAVIEDSLYGAYVIKRFRFNDEFNLAAAQVQSSVIITADERLLRQCLDRYDNRHQSLIADPHYLSERKAFTGASYFAYASMGGLTQLLAQLRSYPSAGEEKRIFSPENTAGLYQRAMAGGWNDTKTGTVKAVLCFDPQRVPAPLQSLYTMIPGQTRSSQRLHTDTIWYYWSNNYPAATIFELLRRQLNQEQLRRLQSLFNELKRATGVDMETAIGWLDNDLTVAIKKSSDRELVPIPLVLTAMKCSSPERIGPFIQRLITHYQVPIRRRNIDSWEVLSWGDVAPVGTFEPSLALYEEYLLLANNFRQIKEFITAQQGPDRLDTSRSFKQVAHGFADANNSLLYINLAELTGQLKELVSWAGVMLALKDPAMANQATIVIDRLINPVLDGLTMYQVIGSRKTLKDHHVIIEAQTIINHEHD